MGRSIPGHLWETLVDDDRCSLTLEYGFGQVFLHFAVRKKTHGFIRYAMTQFEGIRHLVKSMGYGHVFVIIPESDGKLYRFCRRMGFGEAQRIEGQILMEQGV